MVTTWLLRILNISFIKPSGAYSFSVILPTGGVLEDGTYQKVPNYIFTISTGEVIFKGLPRESV